MKDLLTSPPPNPVSQLQARSIREALATYAGDAPLDVIYPDVMKAKANQFTTAFPGHTLYAVKANPHPIVLAALWAGGVRHFDVASLGEVLHVHRHIPDADMYFMHPVKSRAAIRTAYDLGVRHYAFDTAQEVDKIIDETRRAPDLHLHLRLAVPARLARMPLDGKFGADLETAITLLKIARPRVAKLGLCFHVGSQCLDPKSYAGAIAYARSVVDMSAITIDSLDIGGGFPVAYPGTDVPALAAYHQAIKASCKAQGFDHLPLFSEPGRVLVAEGGSSLARVDLRKGQDLYLNDGSYGALFDAAICDWRFPVRLHRPGPVCEIYENFRFFGPTCDSLDMMAGPFTLPANTKEGDWVEIGHLGAYGQTLRTGFNGFTAGPLLIIPGEVPQN